MMMIQTISWNNFYEIWIVYNFHTVKYNEKHHYYGLSSFPPPTTIHQEDDHGEPMDMVACISLHMIWRTSFICVMWLSGDGLGVMREANVVVVWFVLATAVGNDDVCL